MPKVVFPLTYWDKWDEFMERTLVLRFRPTIQRYGSSGRPLRRKKVPETVVELKPVERPDSQFDLNATASMTEEETMLDEQTGAFVNVKASSDSLSILPQSLLSNLNFHEWFFRVKWSAIQKTYGNWTTKQKRKKKKRRRNRSQSQ